MKPITKLAAAVAMAFSIGVLPQAHAKITLKSGGLGDALLFPVFNGYVDNYFTVNNSSDKWIQAHVRFRNGAWCGELLDFDVILSPGDVFVFRLADIDGDGYWEIDQSLDSRNFEYTGILQSCGPDTDKGTNNGPSVPALTGTSTDMCMDQNDLLVPDAGGNLTEELIEHARHTGYVEIFAEGVLDGMTHDLMNQFIASNNAGKLAAEGQREIGNKLGTSIWSWVDFDAGAKSYHATRTASDVDNVLSGTAFITIPGSGMGIVYTAEALADFRTNNNPHRIDNYHVAVRGATQKAVIVHDENSIGSVSGPSPFGDYLYGIDGENRFDEKRISFNNTWGPTIADGDDYNVAATWNVDPFNEEVDSWDNEWNAFGSTGLSPTAELRRNSIAEVDDAIAMRTAAGGQQQVYTSFYFADESINNANLNSWFFAVFPTKFFAGEIETLYGASTAISYATPAADRLLGLGKAISQELWDHEERPGVFVPPTNTGSVCTQSPCIADTIVITPARKLALAQCVSLFSINDMKGFFENSASFTKGRMVIECDSSEKSCNPKNNPFTNAKEFSTWSFLGYTFDFDQQNGKLGNWRAMAR